MKVFDRETYLKYMDSFYPEAKERRREFIWPHTCDGKPVEQCKALGYGISDDWVKETDDLKTKGVSNMKYYVEHEVTSGIICGKKYILDNDGEVVEKTEDRTNVYITDKVQAEFLVSVLNHLDDGFGVYEAKPIEEYDDYPYFKHIFDETLHYIQWLSKEVLDKIIVNTCKSAQRTHADAYIVQYILDSSNVDVLFDWSTTEEGHDYWKRISQAIINVRSNVL